MIRRSSGRRNRRSTAPTPPGQILGICRYRTRSHESAAPPHVTSTRGCNGTDTSTLRIIGPTSLPAARLISARSRPTTTRRRRCASISSAPSAPASRRSSSTHHNESLVTWDLCKMTATRPVTTPNLHFAPPCAKPADHHDTPHKDGRLFNAAQKKEPRRAPKRNIADKDPSPQRERRAM